MTIKIKYEKPMFFDLSGNDAMIAQGQQLDYLNCRSGSGAVGSCTNGPSAAGTCQNGNQAVSNCYNGSNAKSYTRCTAGQGASQSCSIGFSVRHS